MVTNYPIMTTNKVSVSNQWTILNTDLIQCLELKVKSLQVYHCITIQGKYILKDSEGKIQACLLII